jgi:NAD(P)H-dependent FMN reductase
MIRIAIIIGSTRPGRRAEGVAHWVHDAASQRDDATYEIVDLAEHNLPHLDESGPAAISQDYTQPHTRAWAARIDSFDGFVFVTPEYNHSTTGVLKNAIDYLYLEWHNKAAGFVSYGINGGVRATEHLRQVMGELQIADVQNQVALSLFDDFGDGSTIAPGHHHDQTLSLMLDQVVAWSGALQTLRPALVPA